MTKKKTNPKWIHPRETSLSRRMERDMLDATYHEYNNHFHHNKNYNVQFVVCSLKSINASTSIAHRPHTKSQTVKHNHIVCIEGKITIIDNGIFRSFFFLCVLKFESSIIVELSRQWQILFALFATHIWTNEKRNSEINMAVASAEKKRGLYHSTFQQFSSYAINVWVIFQ